jgi:hypothetical protein
VFAFREFPSPPLFWFSVVSARALRNPAALLRAPGVESSPAFLVAFWPVPGWSAVKTTVLCVLVPFAGAATLSALLLVLVLTLLQLLLPLLPLLTLLRCKVWVKFAGLGLCWLFIALITAACSSSKLMYTKQQ